MVDLHIVTVNFLSKDVLLSMLESVFRDLKDCPYTVAVTVVDNSQNRDGVKDALSVSFPQVVYIDAKENLGFGKANNIGFRSKEARYYLALNPDTLLKEQKTIDRMIAFLDAHPTIGAIGPKLTNADGTVQSSCYRFDLPSIFVKPLKHVEHGKRIGRIRTLIDRLHMSEFDHETTRPVDWVLGAALMVRQEVTKQVGFFDERYFMYTEDADWCRAMWHHGWPVYYVHDIIITHLYSRDSAKISGVFQSLLKNKLARIHLLSWVKFLWKWRHEHRFYEHTP
jgi:GT2 family glycosyltransferase